MSTIADIADAIVAALNGGSFSESFTAVRRYRPQYDLEDVKTLRVTVVPKTLAEAAATRVTTAGDLEIDVAVQKKLAATTGSDQTAADEAEIDGLMDLVQEIREFIRATGAFGVAQWLKTRNAPIYSVEHLAELRQFTSLLTLSLKVMT